MQSISPGPAADLARRMTPDLLQSSASTRRVGPFHMAPATAQAMILQRLQVHSPFPMRLDSPNAVPPPPPPRPPHDLFKPASAVSQAIEPFL